MWSLWHLYGQRFWSSHLLSPCKCAEHINCRKGLMPKEQVGWDKAGKRKLLLLLRHRQNGPKSILTEPEMSPGWTSALWILRGLTGGLFSTFFWEQFVKGQKYQQKTIFKSTSFKLHLPPPKIKKSGIMPMRNWGNYSTAKRQETLNLREDQPQWF